LISNLASAGFLPGENMPASLNSQIGSKEQYNAELVQKFFHAESRHARVIESFDPDSVTASVRPAIKGYDPVRKMMAGLNCRCWWTCL
jgi:hypothetical protein